MKLFLKCGDSDGSLCAIDFYDSATNQTTHLYLCSGCSGSLIAYPSSSVCGLHSSLFDATVQSLCSYINGNGQGVTVYRYVIQFACIAYKLYAWYSLHRLLSYLNICAYIIIYIGLRLYVIIHVLAVQVFVSLCTLLSV